ncbi:CHAT domain-containing protein [Aerosakkonemataceae cyanobacterium BLCC-F50]|uniref:CHAT domain-containing protein n=1 Tax=Floridaenema flaviceps BLCC-F50 TaxID=3153642 RepID=A0ABV4XIT7_9CYAN
MSKLVILTVAEGNFDDGFPAILRIGEEGKSPNIEVSGKLPPTPQIPESYSQWQLTYRSFTVGRLEPMAGQLRNVSITNSFQTLHTRLNDWLSSESFRLLREKFCQNVSPDEEVRVIIRTSVRELQRLPWHLWNLFADYSNLEVAISSPESEIRANAKTPTYKDKVRILAILGNSQGIDTHKDRELLEQLPDAEITFLVEPGRKEITDQLWEQSWDILFFAGHSKTEVETGRIYLNQTESLTINELRYGLKKAIQGGLQLAIFNSCDGLGLAWQLEELHIPQTIVMREPVPDLVAQEFLKYFLTAFAGKNEAVSYSYSLYQAVREARERLQGLENSFPCASLLPVICQNSTAVPPKWENLGRRPTNICPYRGLFAFGEEDARFFFGRFDFTAELVEAVANQSLVAIVGPSGIGKSSVVFAGLIPQLRREGNWQVVRLRPGDRPFTALAIAIASVGELNLHITEQRQKVQDLAAYLRDKNGALRDAVEGILWDIPDCHLLLVVDQFEELYTVCQDEEERLCFLDRLLEVVGAMANFKLVLTLRADFLGQALSYRPFADALQHQDLKLGPMKRLELEEAIARPAEKLGVAIEEGLTKRLLDAVEKQPGNLPLLEFALTQLWSKMSEATLTHAAYDDIGGVEKALANHAEEVFARFPEEQERMRRIFIQLVHPGEGTWDTRRVASRAEVGEENWDLVTRLASERLVVGDGKDTTGSETVEIAHEALIGGWARLQEWIHANRRFRTWQERLRVSLRQWEENQRVDGALLQRVPLAEAEGWLQERGGELSAGEREFIRLSLELRDREQAEKEATEQAQQILDKAYRKAKRRIGIGSAILAVSLVGAVIAGVMAGNALHRQREAQEGARLEQAGISALRQFESGSEEIESLLSAMKAGQDLKAIVKDNRPLEQYPTLSPILGLQKILDNIRQVNLFKLNNFRLANVSFTSDGKLLLLTYGNDSIARLWNIEGHQLAEFKGSSNLFRSVSFSSDSKLLATVGDDGIVRLWNMKGEQLAELRKPNKLFSSVSITSDGKLMATAEKNGIVRLWNRKEQQLAEIKTHQEYLDIVRFSPDGKLLATAGISNVSLWNINGQNVANLQKDSGFSRNVNFSTNGKLLATAGYPDIVKLWNISLKPSPINGQQLDEFKTHHGSLEVVTFSPHSNLLATAGGDGIVRLWKLNNLQMVIPKSGLMSYLNKPHSVAGGFSGISISPDGKIFATAEDDSVMLWNSNGQQFAKLKAHHYVDVVTISPDSKLLATAEDDSIVRVRNFNGQQLGEFNTHQRNVKFVSFSPDSKLLATAGVDDIVKLWSINGQQLAEFKTDQRSVTSVSFSPDSKLLATGGMDNKAKIWNLNGRILATLNGHKGWIYSVSFSPDSKLLATAGKDGIVKLWHLNGQLLGEFKVLGSGYYSEQEEVNFSPDGKLIATVGGDGIARLWTLSGQQVAEFKSHQGKIEHIRFSQDGKKLTTVDKSGKVQFWRIRNLDELLAQGCDWLKDYFVTHPEALKELHVCQADKQSTSPR